MSNPSNIPLGLTWYQLPVSFTALPENALTEIDLGFKKVGLLKRQQNIYAFAAKCPHAGAPLCGGWVDGLGRIVCPDHKYRFDPANGRNTSGEGYKLFTYPTEIRDDEVWVALMPPNPASALNT